MTYTDSCIMESKSLPSNLLELSKTTGYPIIQHNGQRKYGPPPDWNGPAPCRGSEVFICKLPRQIFEDELVPPFSKIGKLYELRLMMNFSGSNRGYAFVTYTTPSDASAAIEILNDFEIRPGHRICVKKSVDNRRLYIGGIPLNKTKEDIVEEMAKHFHGVVDVIVYQNCYDRCLNRGFAFVEFNTHDAAVVARRALVPGFTRLWNEKLKVDWAVPDVDDDELGKVKVLYVRNLMVTTSATIMKMLFEASIKCKVEKVKKMADHAFVHFYAREDAERAMSILQNKVLNDLPMQIKWAKPVDRQLYNTQKSNRGNAKFICKNDGLMYNVESAVHCLNEDIGTGACNSPESNHQNSSVEPFNYNPIVKLNIICQSYNWALPEYTCTNFIDSFGNKIWLSTLWLPEVGMPILNVKQSIGPISRQSLTMKEAQMNVAQCCLEYLQALHTAFQNMMQNGVPATYLTPHPAIALPTMHLTHWRVTS